MIRFNTKNRRIRIKKNLSCAQWINSLTDCLNTHDDSKSILFLGSTEVMSQRSLAGELAAVCRRQIVFAEHLIAHGGGFPACHPDHIACESCVLRIVPECPAARRHANTTHKRQSGVRQTHNRSGAD
jgi:LmbE family N-acetylglucosaminyl deacetylase